MKRSGVFESIIEKSILSLATIGLVFSFLSSTALAQDEGMDKSKQPKVIGAITSPENTPIEYNLNNGTFALGGTYHMNLQDPDGDTSNVHVGLGLNFSYYFSPNHELGLGIDWRFNEQKTSRTASGATSATTTKAKTSITSASLFYRYNFLVTSETSLYPLAAYVGIQAGSNILVTESGSTTTDINNDNMLIGGQFGFNWMLSHEFAINFHALQFDTVFDDDSRIVISQSIGVKYFW